MDSPIKAGGEREWQPVTPPHQGQRSPTHTRAIHNSSGASENFWGSGGAGGTVESGPASSHECDRLTLAHAREEGCMRIWRVGLAHPGCKSGRGELLAALLGTRTLIAGIAPALFAPPPSSGSRLEDRVERSTRQQSGSRRPGSSSTSSSTTNTTHIHSHTPPPASAPRWVASDEWAPSIWERLIH